MNDSFFYALRKMLPFFSKVSEVMQPRIREKLKVEERMLQLLLWSIVFSAISIPVSEFSLYMVDLAGNNSISGVFWFIVGVFALETGFLSVIYLFFLFLVFIPLFTLFKMVQKSRVKTK